MANSKQTQRIEEKEVLRLLAAGYSNREIAKQLNTEAKTIAEMKAEAMKKFGLKSRIDIIRYVEEQGWPEV